MMSLLFRTRRPIKIDINVETVIREVHCRPALWNKNCEGYSDRRLKARMWEDVCKNVINNWRNLQLFQKNKLSNKVQKKWSNIKDAFKKEVKIRKKVSAGLQVKRKRQCIHFNALSFLSYAENDTITSTISLDGNDNESDNGSDNESDDSSIDQEHISSSSTCKRTRNKNPGDDESLMMIKCEHLNFEEECTIEQNEQSKENNDENLDIELEKSDALDESSQRCNHQRHFVEINYDDNSNSEINNQMVINNPSNDFVKVTSEVKVYDKDISFTEMMVPMLRGLNQDQKHFAKIEILKILHTAYHYNPST